MHDSNYPLTKKNYCFLFLFIEVSHFIYYQNLTLIVDIRDGNKEICQFTESLSTEWSKNNSRFEELQNF